MVWACSLPPSAKVADARRVLHEMAEIQCFRGDDFLLAGVSGIRICEERRKALEFGLLWRKTLKRSIVNPNFFRNES